jgi:hypothetical protein
MEVKIMKDITKVPYEDFEKRKHEAKHIIEDIDVRRLIPKKIKSIK